MGEAKRKNQQFRKMSQPCVFCGSPQGTTKDHAPPKSVFAKPRPHLITVPACSLCNSGTSQLDEQFKAFLSLQVGGSTPEAKRFWLEGGMRTIKGNQRLYREIAGGPRVIIRDQEGNNKETFAFKWNSEAHDHTIEKITRGLYWHHFGEVLLPTTQISVYFFLRPDAEMIDLFNSLQRHSIGGDERFVYGFGRGNENPQVSIWLYQFYEGHWAGAFTAADEITEDESED